LPEAAGEAKGVHDAAGEAKDDARTRAEDAANAYAERYLGELEQTVKQGNGRALLYAIHYCIETGRPVPLFFAQEWTGRFNPWLYHQVRTLDEAFNVARPKGLHFHALKKRAALREPIVLGVLQVQRTQGLPIDGEIFAIVGKRVGVSERFVREVWYSKEGRRLRGMLELLEKTINDCCRQNGVAATVKSIDLAQPR
jgi:hypothetical protein